MDLMKKMGLTRPDGSRKENTDFKFIAVANEGDDDWVRKDIAEWKDVMKAYNDLGFSKAEQEADAKRRFAARKERDQAMKQAAADRAAAREQWKMEFDAEGGKTPVANGVMPAQKKIYVGRRLQHKKDQTIHVVSVVTSKEVRVFGRKPVYTVERFWEFFQEIPKQASKQAPSNSKPSRKEAGDAAAAPPRAAKGALFAPATAVLALWVNALLH